jgi:hypothetical protein
LGIPAFGALRPRHTFRPTGRILVRQLWNPWLYHDALVVGGTVQSHPERIDRRHMLPSLRRKPGAFARWVLRDAMFPRSECAQAWEHLSKRLSERAACRLMVGLLDLADRAKVVTELAGVLEHCVSATKCPTSTFCASGSRREPH